MRALLCLPLLFAVHAFADENDDRAAISRTIAALNVFPQPTTLFTADADASSVLDELWNVKGQSARVSPSTSSDPLPPNPEPEWERKARGVFNGIPGVCDLFGCISGPARGRVESLNPRIQVSTTRFITPDVVLAEGSRVWTDEAKTTQATPLLFVMKKEGDAWKIASIQVLGRLLNPK
jgi:hypothetical protein